MWSRKELKQKGKAAFKANYWSYVIVAAILMAILGAGAGASSKQTSSDAIKEQISSLSAYEFGVILAILGAALLIAIVISVLIKIFIRNPIMVGAYRFFIDGSNGEEVQLNSLLYAFKNKKFMQIFLTMFLKDLFLSLWTLLFIIPGIIKGYSYRMVPYILADNPDMSPNEIIAESCKMMKGNKMKSFVLDLSFIGWILLEIITLGIAGVFYVNPYIHATEAELYKVLKENR